LSPKRARCERSERAKGETLRRARWERRGKHRDCVSFLRQCFTVSPGSSTGLALSGAAVVLDNVSFSGNDIGILAYDSYIEATNVTFSNNTSTTTPAGFFLG